LWEGIHKNVTDRSREIKELRDNEFYNQDLVEEILREYEIAIDIAFSIKTKVQSNLWLTELDDAKVEEFNRTLIEINKLTEKLNEEAKKSAESVKQENYQTCLANWEAYVSSKEACKKFLE
jgi:hypothetical protein